MEPVNLFELATHQSRWLSVRQSAIAGNVANANTPGYKTQDVEPFEKVLGRTGVRMAATSPLHLAGNAPVGADPAIRQDGSDIAVMPSGNNVRLEDELLKAGEVRRAFELNTSIVRAFHRMSMLVTKS